MSKRKTPPPHPSPLDQLSGQSETQRIIQQGLDRQQELQTGGRGKAGHGRKYGVDKSGRIKITADLTTLERREQVQQLSTDLGVPISDIVDIAIAVLHELYTKNLIDLSPFKHVVSNNEQPWRSRTRLLTPTQTAFFGPKEEK